MTLSRMVRATASIEPPDGGVHRSSTVVVFSTPLHVPAIHATWAIVAEAFAVLEAADSAIVSVERL